MAVKEGIIQILNDSQSSLHNHQKLLRKLKAFYEQHQNVEDFFETFFLPFTNALVVYKREPAVERVIDFIAKFAISTAPTGTCLSIDTKHCLSQPYSVHTHIHSIIDLCYRN